MNMNKSQLIENLSEKTNRSINETEQTVRIFFDNIKKALAEGDKVEIRGFGSFVLKKYKGYTGRNPKTGEPVEVEPKVLPVFRTGKDLKERIMELD